MTNVKFVKMHIISVAVHLKLKENERRVSQTRDQTYTSETKGP